jgi:hypothetical protein
MTKAFRGSTTDPEITFTFIIILCKYMQECYIRQATVHWADKNTTRLLWTPNV